MVKRGPLPCHDLHVCSYRLLQIIQHCRSLLRKSMSSSSGKSHSFTHSLTRSLTHLLTYSLTYSLTYLLKSIHQNQNTTTPQKYNAPTHQPAHPLTKKSGRWQLKVVIISEWTLLYVEYFDTFSEFGTKKTSWSRAVDLVVCYCVDCVMSYTGVAYSRVRHDLGRMYPSLESTATAVTTDSRAAVPNLFCWRTP